MKKGSNKHGGSKRSGHNDRVKQQDAQVCGGRNDGANQPDARTGSGPYIDLTLNGSFKAFLMHNHRLCIRILQCYIAALRYRKIKKITFLNKEPLPKQKESKQPRLDALVELDDHELVNIEMQYLFQVFFRARVLYYWAVAYASALAKGQEYEKLRPTYVLVFTHFDLWPELKEMCSSFSLRCNEKNKIEFSEHLTIVVVNLKQIKKLSLDEVLKLDKELILGYLIVNSSHLTYEEVERIKQVDDTLNKAGEALQDLSRNQRAVMAVDADEKLRRDIAAIRYTGELVGFDKGHAKGREEGHKEGRQEGLRQKQIDMARRMLRAGEPVSKICEFTELSEAEVRKL